jgi:hypothetical protein
MVIFGVDLKMFSQPFNPFGQEGDLDFRGSRVSFMDAELLDNFALLFCHLRTHLLSFFVFCTCSPFNTPFSQSKATAHARVAIVLGYAEPVPQGFHLER